MDDPDEPARSRAAVSGRFRDVAVPRPPWWTVDRLVADSIELWLQHEEDRMHQRVLYRRDGPAAPWTSMRLWP